MDNKWVRCTQGTQVFDVNLSTVRYISTVRDKSRLHFDDQHTLTVDGSADEILAAADAERGVR